jgi:GNAT superfamily N-acetyltransferase
MTAPPSRIRRLVSDDLSAVVDLINACDVADTGSPDTTRQDIENDWAMDGFDPTSDGWVASAGEGQIVGYAYVGDQLRTGELEGDVWVHPQRHEPALTGRLMNLVERRAHELARSRGYGEDATLDVFCIATGRAKRNVLIQRGFVPVRAVYRMGIDLATPAPPAALEGVELRPFEAGRDERTMHATMSEAFSGHQWRSSEPFDAWQARLIGHGAFDPGLWFIAWEGEAAVGALIAYDHGDLGWIQSLGVREEWRRRGIGSALLARSFVELARRGQHRVELGVDAEGATQPLRLYERLGMRVIIAYEVYRKHLCPQAVSSP